MLYRKKEIDEMIMFAIEEKQTKDEKDKQKKVESSSDSDSDFYKVKLTLVARLLQGQTNTRS